MIAGAHTRPSGQSQRIRGLRCAGRPSPVRRSNGNVLPCLKRPLALRLYTMRKVLELPDASAHITSQIVAGTALHKVGAIVEDCISSLGEQYIPQHRFGVRGGQKRKTAHHITQTLPNLSINQVLTNRWSREIE